MGTEDKTKNVCMQMEEGTEHSRKENPEEGDGAIGQVAVEVGEVDCNSTSITTNPNLHRPPVALMVKNAATGRD